MNNGGINHKRHLQGDHMNAVITTVGASNTTKVLGLILLSIIALVGLSMLMVSLHGAGNWSGGLMLGNDDISDSVIGWMIAIPVLIITAVIVTIVMLGVGIILAAVMAMMLVLGLVAVVFGLAMTVLPIAAFIALPVLLVWGMVKLVSRDKPALAAHAHAQAAG